MTKEQAEFLIKVTEECGNQDITLCDDYSARYAYGEKTYGVIVESALILMVDIINYAREIKMDDVPYFEGLDTDNMGKDVILY